MPKPECDLGRQIDGGSTIHYM